MYLDVFTTSLIIIGLVIIVASYIMGGANLLFLIIIGIAFIIGGFFGVLMQDHYTINGEICNKIMWDHYGQIQMQDRWYTLPDKEEYLNANVGDAVLLEVVEFNFGSINQRTAKIIEPKPIMPKCAKVCNCTGDI